MHSGLLEMPPKNNQDYTKKGVCKEEPENESEASSQPLCKQWEEIHPLPEFWFHRTVIKPLIILAVQTRNTPITAWKTWQSLRTVCKTAREILTFRGKWLILSALTPAYILGTNPQRQLYAKTRGKCSSWFCRWKDVEQKPLA